MPSKMTWFSWMPDWAPWRKGSWWRISTPVWNNPKSGRCILKGRLIVYSHRNPNGTRKCQQTVFPSLAAILALLPSTLTVALSSNLKNDSAYPFILAIDLSLLLLKARTCAFPCFHSPFPCSRSIPGCTPSHICCSQADVRIICWTHLPPDVCRDTQSRSGSNFKNRYL